MRKKTLTVLANSPSHILQALRSPTSQSATRVPFIIVGLTAKDAGLILARCFLSFAATSRIAFACVLFLLWNCLPVEAAGTESPLVTRVPLQDRANPSGANPNFQTQFELMPATRTGVDLVHQFPAGASMEMLQDQRSGSGICMGDYDQDGHPDLYVTHYARGNRLYRNLGNWQFADVTSEAGVGGAGRWCGGATFADVDNDGDLDLYVCVFNGANLLYLNQGDGTFVERAREYQVDFKGASVMAAFADFDRDGFLDFYLVTSRLTLGGNDQLPKASREAFQRGYIRAIRGGIEVSPAFRELFDTISKGPGRAELIIAGQVDRLYRNRAGSRFEDVTQTAGLTGNHIGLAALWWDSNDDGFPDLYVSNDYKGPDQLYLNKGNGTFADITTSALPCVPWSSMGSDFADINNDGHFDLFATDMAGSTHARRILNYSDPEKDRWFMLSANPQQYRRNTLFVNSGTGRFLELAQLAGIDSTDWTWSPKFGDLDNDGWIDLFISNGMSRDFINRDLMNRAIQPAAWADTPVLRERNFAFRNRGNLQFESVGQSWGLDQLSASYGAAYGDLDRDGDLDLVVCNFGEPISVFRNHSQTGQRVLIRLRGTTSNAWGIGAIVQVETASKTQTQQLMLCRGFMSANEPILHFGLGDDPMIKKLTVRWPNGTHQWVEQLAAGYLYTITEPQSSTSAPERPTPKTMWSPADHFPAVVHRETEFDDYSQQPLLPFKLSQFGPPMAWGDVNQDGDADVFIGGAAGQSGTLLIRGPNGQFQPSPQPAWNADLAREDTGALFLDANGDGTLDLYVVSGGVEHPPGDLHYRDRLYLNDGKGLFTKAPDRALPDLRDSGGPVVAADFDRDGDLDLFVGSRSLPGRYPFPPQNRLLRNDQGRFTEATDALAPGLKHSGMATSALWSDYDSDGWLDLFVTHEWGPVKLFRNRSGALTEVTESAGLHSLRGWWNAIDGRDLNGDGHIDYVLSNFGLNSKYRATPKEPAILLAGKIDGRSEIHLIEAAFEGNRLIPWRGKNSLSAAMPILAEKFPSFESFAAASLSDMFSPEAIAQAFRLEANTLESGILMNNGQGAFEFNPLPRLAQAAPVFGIALTELDGDGFPDLYLGQNFSPMQPENGRMNGSVSLLLRGIGGGQFLPVWPDQSGLVVPEDARSVTVADLNSDRWPDLVVGINNGPVRSFLNRGAPGKNRMLRVYLTGKQSNPQAAGAKATIRLNDRSAQSAEIYAGNGYRSQSAGPLYFGLGPNRHLVQVQVRWPNGQLTTNQFTSITHELDLRYQQP